MNEVKTYTSTGIKLLRHPELLMAWKNKRPIPYSLQVALTEKCNLNCKFCSVKNRSRKYEWKLEDLVAATEKFYKMGTKTVEITGGGEPLCYPYINQYLEELFEMGMKIGLITNGIGINELLDKKFLDIIKWIRISSNVYDYRKVIDIPISFKGTLGFSYVWTDEVSNLATLMEIREIALANNVKYIRLVPNCLSTDDEQRARNASLDRMAEILGPPFFFQRKEFKRPKNCYWGYFKPFLYCDGYVYPCSSIVLNEKAEERFHPGWRICHWTSVQTIWNNPIRSLAYTEKCNHCVFSDQNEATEYMLNEQEHEDFL